MFVPQAIVLLFWMFWLLLKIESAKMSMHDKLKKKAIHLSKKKK